MPIRLQLLNEQPLLTLGVHTLVEAHVGDVVGGVEVG
jgi:hypothetical protein